MKKLFALVMALMLALGCVSALAESEAPAYQVYTHPVIGYTLEYPTTWLALDTETLPVMMAMAQSTGIEGIDLSMLGNMEEQIVSANMTMFFDMMTGANFTIGAQDLGMPIDVASFNAMMLPMLKAQYEQMFANCTFADDDPTVVIGDKEYSYLSATYVANGQTTCLEQFYLVDGTVMYVIAGTYAQDRATDELINTMGYILATFTPAAK